MRKVTMAWMRSTDGTTTTYIVSRSFLHEGKKPYVDLNDPRTEDVGSITRTDKPSPFSGTLGQYYLEMAKRFETPEFPAFSF